MIMSTFRPDGMWRMLNYPGNSIAARCMIGRDRGPGGRPHPQAGLEPGKLGLLGQRPCRVVIDVFNPMAEQKRRRRTSPCRENEIR
jgi:hypothetical protein